MAYRRKIIDRRTREGRKLGKFLDGAVGLGIVVVLIVGWLGSRSNGFQPAQEVGQASTSIGDSDHPPSTVLGEPSNDPTAKPTSLLAQPTSAESTHRALVRWPHTTSGGVRWRLRHAGGVLLLLVDLGRGEVASVTVDPAFEALDLEAMNARVDHIRELIGQRSTSATASYSFERNGDLQVLP